jgi:diaminopimelate epimerase
MQTPFHKMHGLGNDFLIFDVRHTSIALTPERIGALADRRTGIGFDQLILLEPASDAVAFMRIFNPDSSQVGACGNATRCVAALMHRENGATKQTIKTLAGTLEATIVAGENTVQVDMGKPLSEWQQIPLSEPADTMALPIEGAPIAVSMGNPHATFFVPDVETYPVEKIGASLECHPLFPERANIGFAQIVNNGQIRLRVWERGAGLTRACGTGACATLVNAARLGLTGRKASILLDGGALTIEWHKNCHVLMTGDAAFVYEGSIDLESLPA